MKSWLMKKVGFNSDQHYEAPADLRVKEVSNVVINIGLVRLSLQQWLRVGRGGTK